MRKYLPLLSAEFLFFLGMWLSKTAWPLWFHESGDMRIYGISYSVMALTGALTVGVGNLVHRYGAPLSFRVGVGLYAVGIGLRWPWGFDGHLSPSHKRALASGFRLFPTVPGS